MPQYWRRASFKKVILRVRPALKFESHYEMQILLYDRDLKKFLMNRLEVFGPNAD
jgi:hypothetical protein